MMVQVPGLGVGVLGLWMHEWRRGWGSGWLNVAEKDVVGFAKAERW